MDPSRRFIMDLDELEFINDDKSELSNVADLFKANSNCPDSEKVGTGP
jgi:hypothetical protein